ncbi:MAG: glucose 1-dehydrogenase [Chloroflexi bacterium]|nr:glucose 1-dehydrogenase [Chloroflexota bacterium]
MYSLKGKIALVTGAAGAGGLGRAIALRLAQEGADLVVNDLSEDKAPRRGLPYVAREIEALGRSALPVYADVSSAAQVEDMIRRTIEHFGRIDILVNNAAASAGRDRVPVVELDEDLFDLILRVNVKGTFLCSRAAARAMIAQGEGGRIINISSTAGRRGYPRYAAYCTSKFAVRGFTQSLAQEVGPHGITVNAICPGLVATERIDDIAAAIAPLDFSVQEQRQTMIANASAENPIGRMTEPGDVARMAAFLASDQAAFLTGMSYVVDGGGQMD